MRYFETRFMNDADAFISGLDPKTIKKIFYNIDLAEQTNDSKLLKKLQNDGFGSFEQNTLEFKSDFLHFGTRRTTKKHW